MDESEEKILKADTLGRVWTSRERREAILDDFEQSGMSGAAYARLRGIRYTTFANWVQKRRRQHRAVHSEKLSTPAKGAGSMELTFAEVKIEERPLPESSSDLRVELPGGATLILNDPCQAELAADLVRRLTLSGQSQAS